MFEIFALICVLGQAPDQCIPQTARAVEKIGEADNEIGCFRWGALSSPRGVIPGEGEWIKISCLRK